MSFKHEVLETRRFQKDRRKLSRDHLEQLSLKVRDVANNSYLGKPLHGPYKDKREIKLGKYRVIYSIPQYCKILLERIIHRESL